MTLDTPATPDFAALRDEAKATAEQMSTTNEWGMEDSFYTDQLEPVLADLKDSRAGETYTDTPEYDDLDCFLDIADACGIEVLVVLSPEMGPYYDHIGIDAKTRAGCYDRVRSVVAGHASAELADFTPLASCPKLDRVNFYAAKLPPAGYASLGALKQVKKFHGGLTKMTSIEWMKQVPQAEEVKIFAEKIPDLTPIASLPNLTYLRLWNMDGGSLSTAVGDLAFLSGNKKLKKLELPGSRYVNTDALAALPLLETVDLYGAKNPVSVAFATRLPKLKILGLGGATVTDGAVVASLPKTVRVRTDKKTQGVPEAK